MKWLVTILFILFATTSYAADTNTVSSTVVTNNTPPTANAPSVVVNNSYVRLQLVPQYKLRYLVLLLV